MIISNKEGDFYVPETQCGQFLCKLLQNHEQILPSPIELSPMTYWMGQGSGIYSGRGRD